MVLFDTAQTSDILQLSVRLKLQPTYSLQTTLSFTVLAKATSCTLNIYRHRIDSQLFTTSNGYRFYFMYMEYKDICSISFQKFPAYTSTFMRFQAAKFHCSTHFPEKFLYFQYLRVDSKNPSQNVRRRCENSCFCRIWRNKSQSSLHSILSLNVEISIFAGFEKQSQSSPFTASWGCGNFYNCRMWKAEL